MKKDLLKKLFGDKDNNELPSNAPTSSNKESDLTYANTPGIKKLLTKESPRKILEEDFPNHSWPISGGWGYTMEDAVVIESTNSVDGVGLEYDFLEFRTYEECIVFRSNGQKMAGINFEGKGQSLMFGKDGKPYDVVRMTVFCFSEQDFKFLKNDWESHDAYKNDEDGKQAHMKLAESKRIQYDIEGWFEISNFFGK